MRSKLCDERSSHAHAHANTLTVEIISNAYSCHLQGTRTVRGIKKLSSTDAGTDTDTGTDTGAIDNT